MLDYTRQYGHFSRAFLAEQVEKSLRPGLIGRFFGTKVVSYWPSKQRKSHKCSQNAISMAISSGTKPTSWGSIQMLQCFWCIPSPTFDVCSRGPAGISFQVKMLEGFFAESEKNEKTMEGRIYMCSGHL